MSSKRKRKRQALAKAASASQLGNDSAPNSPLPQPTTSVGKAMTKAKNNSPKPKIIKGFGSKTDGAVIHAITDIEQSALCDGRIKDIAYNDDLTAIDVTCAKCQKYVVFKQALDLSKVALPETEKPKPKPKKKKIEKGKVISVKDKPPVATIDEVVEDRSETSDPSESVNEEQQESIDEMFEKLRTMMDFKFKKLEGRLQSKLEKHCDKIIIAKPSFFIVRKANNMYEVIHDASRYVICDNVKEADAEALLILYLEIEPKWDGQTKPSKEWLGAIRKVHEEYFPKKTAEKTGGKRSLKRRPRPSLKQRKDRKPEKRTIKRRSK